MDWRLGEQVRSTEEKKGPLMRKEKGPSGENGTCSNQSLKKDTQPFWDVTTEERHVAGVRKGSANWHEGEHRDWVGWESSPSFSGVWRWRMLSWVLGERRIKNGSKATETHSGREEEGTKERQGNPFGRQCPPQVPQKTGEKSPRRGETEGQREGGVRTVAEGWEGIGVVSVKTVCAMIFNLAEEEEPSYPAASENTWGRAWQIKGEGSSGGGSGPKRGRGADAGGKRRRPIAAGPSSSVPVRGGAGLAGEEKQGGK